MQMIQSISVTVSDENANKNCPSPNSKSLISEDQECERNEMWRDLSGMTGSCNNQMPKETRPH